MDQKKIAGEARTRMEEETGNPVITNQNATSLNAVVTGMIEEVTKVEKKQTKAYKCGGDVGSVKEIPTWMKKQ